MTITMYLTQTGTCAYWPSSEVIHEKPYRLYPPGDRSFSLIRTFPESSSGSEKVWVVNSIFRQAKISTLRSTLSGQLSWVGEKFP